jgi:hypothetical protein
MARERRLSFYPKVKSVASIGPVGPTSGMLDSVFEQPLDRRKMARELPVSQRSMYVRWVRPQIEFHSYAEQ